MMTAEVDNFLEHYGVPGMKWGKRKAVAPSTSPKMPSYGRQLAVGTIGNSKSRFTDPKALATRKKSGKLAAAAVVTSLAATGLQMTALNSKNPSVKQGAALAANILGKGAGVASLASAVSGITAVSQERAARAGS